MHMLICQNCIHVANFLYLASYLVRDIFHLRILTIVAMCTLMPYYFQGTGEPLLQPILWNAVFLVINGYQVHRLIQERRPPKLTEEERRLHELVFQGVTPRKMLKILAKATWKEAEPGTHLVEEGTYINELMLIYSGEATVCVGRKELAALGAGDFVGEISFLTQGNTTAHVHVQTQLRYLSWPKAEFDGFLEQESDLKIAVQSVIGANLIEKLCSMRDAVIGRADNPNDPPSVVSLTGDDLASLDGLPPAPPSA